MSDNNQEPVFYQFNYLNQDPEDQPPHRIQTPPPSHTNFNFALPRGNSGSTAAELFPEQIQFLTNLGNPYHPDLTHEEFLMHLKLDPDSIPKYHVKNLFQSSHHQHPDSVEVTPSRNLSLPSTSPPMTTTQSKSPNFDTKWDSSPTPLSNRT
eukprot:gene9568-19880_t